jgi:hypothetical protein
MHSEGLAVAGGEMWGSGADGRPILERFYASELRIQLLQKPIFLCVSPGRSGTRLLCSLLKNVLDLDAEHEPDPRANFVMRPNIGDNVYALRWLVERKLPAIAARGPAPYVETSHLFCKGLIEPLFALGLRPRFFILRREARAVASSLYQMNVIPQRTPDGALVLVGPNDPGTMPLEASDRFTDYQLCYWYALEIERRQALYHGLFSAHGVGFLELTIHDLTDWMTLGRILKFVGLKNEKVLSRDDFEAVTSRNQNPRHVAHPGNVDRPLPANIEAEESEIHACCAPYFLTSALSVGLKFGPAMKNEGNDV